jgi:transcriptional regulator NrdR family protein
MSVLCSKCGKPGKVKDSRRKEGVIHRRRECCGERWSTWEGEDEDQVDALRQEIHDLKQRKQSYQTIISGIRAALGGKT